MRVAAQVASQLRKGGGRRKPIGEADLKEPVEAADLAAEDVAAAADLALLAEVNPLGLGSPRADPLSEPRESSGAPLEKVRRTAYAWERRTWEHYVPPHRLRPGTEDVCGSTMCGGHE